MGWYELLVHVFMWCCTIYFNCFCMHSVFQHTYLMYWLAQCAQTVRRSHFFWQQNDYIGRAVMSIVEIVWIVRLSVYVGFVTCRKTCAPTNHELRRYLDLQIPHGESLGEQVGEFHFARLVAQSSDDYSVLVVCAKRNLAVIIMSQLWAHTAFLVQCSVKQVRVQCHSLAESMHPCILASNNLAHPITS